ncbi:MAG: hypothetical protein ACK414_01555, partial [Gemmobacter sp.]
MQKLIPIKAGIGNGGHDQSFKLPPPDHGIDPSGTDKGMKAKGRRQNVMVSQNRILTVSYGTFSCTLEGFDDPFGTMKAIAEYFRDLAAEDRYFGAEPPQPDAAMLHRIAEREIQRRVEAKIQDNGVILRAADLLDAPVKTRPAEPVATPAVAPVDATPRVAQGGEPAPKLRGVDEGVVAKLARIRAAVDRSRAAAPTLDEIEDAELPEAAPLPPAPAADLIEDLPEDNTPLASESGDWPEAEAVVPVAATPEPAAPPPEADTEAETVVAEEAPASVPPEAPIELAAAAEPAEAPAASAAAEAVSDATTADETMVAEAPAVASPVAEPPAPRQVSGWHLRRRQRRLNREAAARAAAEAAGASGAPDPAVAEPAGEPLAESRPAEPAAAVDFDLDALEATLEGIEAEVQAEAAGAGSPNVAAPAPAAAAEDDVAALISRLAGPETR